MACEEVDGEYVYVEATLAHRGYWMRIINIKAASPKRDHVWRSRGALLGEAKRRALKGKD